MQAGHNLYTDEEIIALFAKADMQHTAFTALVHKYQQRLYWHIRRLVVTHDDTDDILQNVLIKVWNNLATFRQEANLFTWLYRIATNETLSWLNAQKKYVAVPIDGNDEFFHNRLQAQSHFDPSKIEWRLQQAIGTLPEKQKLVFCMRYYDETPYEDMSQILGTSVGALKASYHHAVKKVEEFLGKN
jgi:RNA polymerase sigma-70 factor (ECF subfamily)